MNFEDYERKGLTAYASLAGTVAAILAAAIEREGGYRLQQVTKRAKSPASLRKKLQDRQIEGTTTLEADIKDLAGCRLVFYTNTDVTRFINSGIIDQNFEVLEVKLHHPRRDAEETTDLYISNHYLVALRPERVALPEYASFEGMRCEIQVQTILNHAWAEMAHDTIYKTPELGNFGATQFDSIRMRLHKVARKYLLPAGYEFQQIAHDFNRLVEGKALFDGDALEAIVQASDNNVRATALETFSESVLPFYDDLPSIYSHVIDRLVAAADVARATQPIAIETPYGLIPAKTFADIVSAIANVLTRYRYVDIEATFDALRTLYGWASAEAERKPLIELGTSLAKHHLQVWRTYGPAAQAALVDGIHQLGDDERRGLARLLTAMLSEVLGAEVTGTTNTSSALTFHRGTVAASDALRDIRKKAIELLKHQFALCEDEAERREVLFALQAATRPAMGAGYSNALARLVMDDTCSIIFFETEVAASLSLGLRQSTETRVHRNYQMYARLPEGMREDENLVAGQANVRAAAFAFRDAVNADQDFVDFKTLVGFDCVYPPAWENHAFEYAEAEAYRTQQVAALLASVNADNADEWFDKLGRYARIESDDAATFPVFGKFLARLAEEQPTIVLGYVDKLDGPLENFMPAMLTGLFASAERQNVHAKVDGWLGEGRYLDEITWYLRSADPFDEQLLYRAAQSALQHDDARAVRNALLACADQYVKHPGTLIERVFLPALRYLSAAQDFSWIRMPWVSWLNKSIIEALDQDKADVMLEALLRYPNLEDASEHIAASIARRWPARVIDFLGRRQALKLAGQAPADYDAVPFRVYQLQAPLAAVPDLMLAGARQWFDADSLLFPFDGGRLLASVFPNLTNGLSERLARIIADGNEADLAFALAVLSAFEGNEVVYEHVRNIVAALDVDSALVKKAMGVLQESGVVSGEFGFAELNARRKASLEPWLRDESDAVKAFAASHIRSLERQIAAEVRAAEASIALRKLSYGEDLDEIDERAPKA
ncbi:RelA/SpoT domain-containing protein [Cupriavidus basilensis]|uniref:RelA/SpoT domain-containing protein n=1 Tax=Cupriavidus basilensis TaxID=68895 RepID=UPI0023E8D81B|nr:RelA/SpoT domain-containing protein [Cupriavidus basilensis]MDF3881139.1 RelA/SpoT domain-containing protein [Cupriavidus basilensis]